MLARLALALPRFFPHCYNARPGEVFGSCWVTGQPLVEVKFSNGEGETVVSAVAGWEVAMATDEMSRSRRPGVTISAEER